MGFFFLSKQGFSKSKTQKHIFAEFKKSEEMGVGGTLEYISELMSSGHKQKKRKQLQTVELKVRMDCDGCELKVRNALNSLSGMRSLSLSPLEN